MRKTPFYIISFLILFISLISYLDTNFHPFYSKPFPYSNFLSLIPKNSSTISIMSYNIRNLYLDLHSKHKWQKRKKKLLKNIIKKHPDIFSIQEDTLQQINFLKNNLYKNYSYFSLFDPNFDKKMNHNSIFYNKKKFSLINGIFFWLNSNNSFNKSDWDAYNPRSATIIELQRKNDKKNFFVCNVHLDHMGKKARRNGIKIVLKKLEEINKKNEPVFLMGDFNESPNHYAYMEVMKKMFNDTWADCVYKYNKKKNNNNNNKNVINNNNNNKNKINNNKLCYLGEQYATSFHFNFGKKINNIFIRNLLYIVYYFHGGKNSFYNRYHIDHMYYKNSNDSNIYPIYTSFPSDDLINNKDGVYASDHFPIFSVFNFDYKS